MCPSYSWACLGQNLPAVYVALACDVTTTNLLCTVTIIKNLIKVFTFIDTFQFKSCLTWSVTFDYGVVSYSHCNRIWPVRRRWRFQPCFFLDICTHLLFTEVKNNHSFFVFVFVTFCFTQTVIYLLDSLLESQKCFTLLWFTTVSSCCVLTSVLYCCIIQYRGHV